MAKNALCKTLWIMYFLNPPQQMPFIKNYTRFYVIISHTNTKEHITEQTL